MLAEHQVDSEVQCYHCGQPCEDTAWQDDKPFCCLGCKTVYEILNANNLCEYYRYDRNPGTQQTAPYEESAFAYLDEPEVHKKLLSFNSSAFSRVEFYVPAIHCVSCIWLLENLKRLNDGILRSEVNFARKTATIDFNPGRISLGQVAALMASVGYAPVINLQSPVQSYSSAPFDKQLVIKLAIAGFCFGNVMLFSFPEYLGLEGDESLKWIFSWLNIALSVPVFLYSDVDYLKSAWKSFRQRQINIDVPVAAGLVALFARSVWDIVTGFGPGYLDSFTGLVFFLLIGRWFQSKTYQSLAFDRDFKSYFPLAVHKLSGTEWKPVVIYELQTGDRLRIRNMEIVPADSRVEEGNAHVDYSFVTGESRPVEIGPGDLVYAGGRLIGQPVIMRVEKPTSQSHLTSLWNNAIFSKGDESRHKRIIDKAAQRFTWVILVLSVISGIYWYVTDASQVWLIITSVLIVACPCALALTSPFTYGNMQRQFGRLGFYLKNAEVIERMAHIDALVFDKTGTVTHGHQPEVKFSGDLSPTEFAAVKQLCSFSTHPFSAMVSKSIRHTNSLQRVENFREIPSKGIEGTIGRTVYRVGSAKFAGIASGADDYASGVYVEVDGEVRGYFQIKTSLRENIQNMLARWGNKVVALVSGDNESDGDRMRRLFGSSAKLLFNQSPHDKLEFIRNLQKQGKKVMMLGDGLNDAGALKQADVGVAVTDDTGVFTPSCDGVLQGTKLALLDKFLNLAKSAVGIVKWGFVLSFLYNSIALGFAVTGHLTPLVAAVLMPLSSISVVVFTTTAVTIVARKQVSDKPAAL